MNFKGNIYQQFLLLSALIGLFSLTHIVQSNAQCTFVGPVTVAPGQTQLFSLEVVGAINNDLANLNQGICGVFLEFGHNLIGELQINLISPAGTTIQLVGTVAPTNPTNLTRWNVSFVPCGDAVSPDNGFSPIWSNEQPWGILGNFVGSYYPFGGCLEDFNSGPVNGFWQIEIINSSLFNVATLRSFAILFCDPDGLDCSICLAKGGALELTDSTYCYKDNELSLDIDLTYVGFRPDPNEYSYLFLVSQNGIIQDTLSVPDLRDFNPGQYELCGLSYLQIEQSDIVDQIIGETIGVLQDTLNSLAPPFCASLSSNCIPITIYPPNDTILITQHICDGDTIWINGIPYSETGIYTADGTDVNGCDSIISLDLKKYELSGIPLSTPDLSCQNNSVQLGLLQIITNFLPAELSYAWSNEANLPIGQNEFLTVDSAGIFHLVVSGESSLTICSDTFTFQINETRIQHTPQIAVSGNLCFGNTFEARVDNPVAGGNYIWTISNGNGIITVKDGGEAADFLVQNGSNLEICVFLDDPCYLTERICSPVQLISAPLITLPTDTTVCGSQVVFDIPGLPGSGQFTFISGPDPSFVIDEITPTQFSISVAEAGDYVFEFGLLHQSCSFIYPVNISFNADVFAVITPVSSDLCVGDSIKLQLALPVPGTFTINLNIPGLGPTLFSGLMHDTILSLNIPGAMFTVDLLSVYPDGNADCIIYLNNQYTFNRFNVPDLSLIPDPSVCNQEQVGGFETSVDFSELSFGISGSINFVNINGTGNGNFPKIDFENVVPGLYPFLIEVDYSSGFCPNIEDTIIVNVLDCSCEDYTVLNDTLEVCGLDIINLNVYKNHTNNGTWEIVDGPPGNTMTLVGGVSANFQDQPSGVYLFQFTLNNPRPFCNSKDTLFVESAPVFSSGEFTVDSLRLCIGLDSMIRLTNWIVNNDPGGKWSYSGTVQLPANSLDSLSGIVNIQSFPAGVYTFEYRPQEGILCFLPLPSFKIIIEENISSSLPDSASLNCDISSLNLGFLPANSGEYTFLWTTLGGVIDPGKENQALLTITTEGLYILSLKNELNQCTIKDSILVTQSEESIDSVEFTILSPQCQELNTGSITILNVFGGNPPFIYKAGTRVGDSSGTISGLSAGFHLVEITDADGCKWIESIEIPGLVTKSVDIGPDRRGKPTDIFNLEFTTDIENSEINYWIWEVFESDTCISCEVFSMSTAKSTPVLFTLVSNTGCIYRDTLWIFIDENFQFFIPDAFSPNTDGINDIIQIFTDDPSIKIEHFEIFDRWGNRVFNAANFFPALEAIGWDGKFEGQDAPPSVYVYKLLLSRNGQPAVFLSGEFLLLK